MGRKYYFVDGGLNIFFLSIMNGVVTVVGLADEIVIPQDHILKVSG